MRTAIAKFEERSTAAIGVRDNPKMQFGKARIKGQMDCVDEYINADGFLRYLQSRNWLKHYTVERHATHSSFIDGCYPHWAAVIKDKSGQSWAVDSWYEVAADYPILCRFKKGGRRGYGGERKHPKYCNKALCFHLISHMVVSKRLGSN